MEAGQYRSNMARQQHDNEKRQMHNIIFAPLGGILPPPPPPPPEVILIFFSIKFSVFNILQLMYCYLQFLQLI